MNILVVASPWLGGSGSVGYSLSKELARQGHRTWFLSYGWPAQARLDDRDLPNWTFCDVTPYRYPLFPFPMYELALAEEIARVVKEFKISVVHAHYGVVFGHAALIAKLSLASQGIPVKVVTTFHGSDALGFDLARPGTSIPRNLNRFLVSESDAVTAASSNLISWIQKVYLTSRPIHQIPNGVSQEFLDMPGGKRRPIIIHISNFRKVKRVLEVVKIFKKISMPGTWLYLVGDGPEKKSVETYIRARKIERVKILGQCSEAKVRGLLARSRILLMPSLYENFSLAALEAQACGVPVVASRVGGFSEVVADTKTGYLVDPFDQNAFARVIRGLLSEEQEWEMMSVQARKHAMCFSEQEIASRYVDLYKTLTKRSSLGSLQNEVVGHRI